MLVGCGVLYGVCRDVDCCFLFVVSCLLCVRVVSCALLLFGVCCCLLFMVCYPFGDVLVLFVVCCCVSCVVRCVLFVACCLLIID